MKLISLATLALALCLAPLHANPLNPKGNAKITTHEAQHIALKHSPGARVAEAKLETVHGTLVWSLKIIEPGNKAPQLVAVDAKTGRIIAAGDQKP
ncbi:MAG: PepSY domain-containing protein [Chthoniobacterales bacterium]